MIAPALIAKAAHLTMRTPAEITGVNSERPLARTRYAIMLTLRRRGWSTIQIGKALRRDHTLSPRGRLRAPDVARRRQGNARRHQPHQGFGAGEESRRR